jgi:uncharacterized protein
MLSAGRVTQGVVRPAPGRQPWRFPLHMQNQRIAVIGSGIAGLSAAWLLSNRNEVTLFEADDRPGGHTNTISIETAEGPLAIDTGFIVFNERNYPNLVALLNRLGVATHHSDMSFSFSCRDSGLEWAGDNLNTVFAQRRNLFRPSFLRMVLDILRFNREAKRLLGNTETVAATESLGEFLDRRGIGAAMRARYLLPMAAAIWSCPQREMLAFPARRFLQFFNNHGLLDLNNRPQWRTVSGGAKRYIDAMLPGVSGPLRLATPVRSVRRSTAGVTLHGDAGELGRYDQVVLACHADQALAMLAQPTADEQALLGAIRYQDNVAWLHTDPALMPRERRVWSSWNYLANPDNSPPAVTYWMNRLQGLPDATPYLVTLNPETPPAEAHVLRRIGYQHPVFDAGAVLAQGRLHSIQGHQGLWYCGSYFGYGFHEDALTAGLMVSTRLGSPPPWRSDAGNDAEPSTERLAPAVIADAHGT